MVLSTTYSVTSINDKLIFILTSFRTAAYKSYKPKKILGISLVLTYFRLFIQFLSVTDLTSFLVTNYLMFLRILDSQIDLTFLRIVNYTDGWLPIAGFGPLEQLEESIDGLREGARKANINPFDIHVFMLTYPNILESSPASSSKQHRLPMSGTTDQIGTDIASKRWVQNI